MNEKYYFLLGSVITFICVITIVSYITVDGTKVLSKQQHKILRNILITIYSILFFIALAVLFYNNATLESQTQTATWGQYGDFIGGVIGTILTGIAGYYAIRTYLTQKEQLDHQKKENERLQLETERQRIETRFFELLKVHRENFEQMEFDASSEEKKYKGDVFKDILKNFKELYPVINYLNDEVDGVKNEQKDNIEITWLLLFFGFDSFLIYVKNGDFKISERFNKLLNLVNKIKKNEFDKYGISGVTIFLMNDKIVDNPDTSGLDFFSCMKHMKSIYGYQSALDKYFRHLFQIVKYINNQSNINYQEKYYYLKVLRAQLSNSEQAIVFINSLSNLGNPWEPFKNLNFEKEEYTQDFIDNANENLITKYNFIKNIPLNYFKFEDLEIDFTKIYSHVHYEHLGKKSSERKKLEEIYN